MGEVLADLELQQARLGSAAAQAEALAQLQQEMGVETRSQEEIRDAAAALQVGGRWPFCIPQQSQGCVLEARRHCHECIATSPECNAALHWGVVSGG